MHYQPQRHLLQDRIILVTGASDGIGVPATATGKVPPAGAGMGAAVARAGCSSIRFSEVAANPPNAAAAVRASRVLVAVFMASLQ